uniref:Protein TsetseEP domain-containing protein n=1 Tax=Anopheles farauti TaxID=69004 RepID=A0A182Q0L7_9DIPT
MKHFIAIFVLCLGVAKLTEAGRPVSTEVVQKLKQLEPVYKKLQDDVINQVAGAKFATAARTDEFYQNIIADKESSLSESIRMEDEFINLLDKQGPSVDKICLDFLRSLTENNMGVAGISYTNCVKNAEAGVSSELDKVYELLQVDEAELFDISLLDVFNGENIITDPAKIIAKMNAKQSEIEGISLSFIADLNAAVNAYAARLVDIGIVHAGRLASMQVVQRLKEIETKNADIFNRIINFVYSAKSNLVQATDEFYWQVIDAKEGSLEHSVALEDELLYQFAHQSNSVDGGCLSLLKTIVDNNMNVAGVGFTNCISTVGKGIDRELGEAQKMLNVDESEIFHQKLLDVFDGENIIVGPDAILGKLEHKANEIDGFTGDYMAGIYVALEKFSSKLWDLRNAYQGCLIENEAILKMTYDASMRQLTSICLGSIVKNIN